MSRSRVRLPPRNAPNADAAKRDFKRDFIARRDELSERFRGYPVRRVAALLIALSELNAHEGRDPSLADSLPCETIASCLELDLDTLGRALDELQQMQLVAPHPPSGPPSGPPSDPPSGLRLTNLAGLYALANEMPGTS